MSIMKHTPIQALHTHLGATMGNEEGWNMPRRYTNLVDEHLAARSACGIFDISHLSKFSIQGKAAEALLDKICCNNVEHTADGHCYDTLLLNRQGVIIDKILLCRENGEQYFIIGSAAQEDTVEQWLRKHLPPGEVTVQNVTGNLSAMSLQGPDSEAIFRKVMPDLEYPAEGSYESMRYRGSRIHIIRKQKTRTTTGFEFFCEANRGIAWFKSFMAAGAIPCGMDARECLRLEQGLASATLDTQNLTPSEASLEHMCHHSKPYLGKENYEASPKHDKRLTPLRCTEESDTPRKGDEVKNLYGQKVGTVTSGCISPALSHGVALAMLCTKYSHPGTPVRIIIHGHAVPAVVTEAGIH